MTSSDLKRFKRIVVKMISEADETTGALPVDQEPVAPEPAGEDEKTVKLPQQADVEAMKTGRVSTGDVIEKLNTIRAGRSFKDSAIKESLRKYVDSLKTSEKVALFSFLKGISQIVTGEVDGEDAVEPADPAPSIQMKKIKFRRVIKPTIIKKRVGNEGQAPVEDTAPPTPAPIQPKK